MALEVEIDREACMGSGQCVFGAPGAYELGDDGIAVVGDLSAAPEEQIIEAGKFCPASAITVRRDGETLT